MNTSSLITELCRVFEKLIFMVLAAIVTLFLFPISKIKNVKISRVPCERYGHLAKNTDLFFRRLEASLLPRAYYILICPHERDKRISNRFLLGLFLRLSKKHREVIIVRSSFLYLGWKSLRTILDRFGLWYDLNYWTCEKEFSATRPVLSLSKAELTKTRSSLREFGLNPNKALVAIFVRDGAYLRENAVNGGTDRSYHHFRNAKIENYRRAIHWLIDQDFQVVRIGGVTDQSLDIARDGFFDYTISNSQTEQLDVCLIGISTFILGTPSGPTDVATVLGIPHLATDYAPFHLVPLGENDLYLPKKIMSVKSKKIRAFKDFISCFGANSDPTTILASILDGNLWRDHYEIEFCDNTPEEILCAVQEMVKRLDGTQHYSEEEKCLHARYFERYWTQNTLNPPNTPIGTDFLRNNADLFF